LPAAQGDLFDPFIILRGPPARQFEPCTTARDGLKEANSLTVSVSYFN